MFVKYFLGPIIAPDVGFRDELRIITARHCANCFA